ncbi:MAG: Rieske (2Fe-2S) protein [Acidobacteria bacterium]|nr:Rieske (2Fe-2S) protein [Acidobacteriota bacterium]
MAFVKVCALSKIAPGSATQVEAGGREYVVCNAEGTVYALDGVCPHAGGPLGHGALHGHMLVCPWHAWEFDCRTGANDFDDAIRVARHEVRVEGDDVLIDIP